MRKSSLAAAVLLIVSLLFYFAYRHQQATYRAEYVRADSVLVANPDTTAVIHVAEMLYGFNMDSFSIIKNEVKRNQTLSDLVSEFEVENQVIYQLAKASKSIFDVRKIALRNPYSLILTKDSVPTLRALVYEPDRTQYVVFHFADSAYAEKVEKQKETRIRGLAAKIESSLYETLLKAGGSPLMVSRLVDMYAWQIDFFHIQPGDYFKVLFEEELIDGEVVNVSRIIAAYFYHGEKGFYSIFYDQGDGLNYFDEKGNSLRKAFLKAPLNFTRISSRYTNRRFHPVLKRYKAHLGTDYAAPRGTPIYTVGDGVVLEARYHGGNGNYVKIKHNATYTTQYLHMSKIARGIKPGKAVKQGEVIGYVGSTGLANGPHLCFRFWRNGKQVDPFTVEIPPSEPIKEQLRNDYFKERDRLIAAMDSLQFIDAEGVLQAGFK